MRTASPFIYVPTPTEEKSDLSTAKKKIEVDSNVISLKFFSLADFKVSDSQPFPPIHCKSCSSVLTLSSNGSNLFPVAEYPQKLESEQKIKLQAKVSEESNDELKPLSIENLSKDGHVWICEFCGTHQEVQPLPSQLTDKEEAFYLLNNPQVTEKEGEEKKTVDLTSGSSEAGLVFCVDYSGSMGTKCGKYSRKDCMVEAIKVQMAAEKAKNPNRKVGLVIFESAVEIYGDGMGTPVTVRDKVTLENFDALFKIGASAYDQTMVNSIEKSENMISSIMKQRNLAGMTALGPGVVASLGLVSRFNPGSTIVICTDGLANIGVGKFEMADTTCPEFYHQAADLATKLGVTINVITIKGSDCRVEFLGRLTDKTNGQILRLEAADIADNMADIFKDEAIATDVGVSVHLARGLIFRHEDKALLNQSQNCWKNNIGNVNKDKQLTFEFKAANPSAAIDGNTFLMQSQVVFTTLQGAKMLIVNTIRLTSTSKIDQALKGANVRLLAARSAQIVAREADAKNLKQARRYGDAWNQLINYNAKEANLENEEIQKEISIIGDKNKGLGEVLKRKIIRGRKKGSIVFSDSEEEANFDNDAKDLSRDASADSDDGHVLHFKRALSNSYRPSNVQQKKSKGKKFVIGGSDDSDEEAKKQSHGIKLPRRKGKKSIRSYSSSVSGSLSSLSPRSGSPISPRFPGNNLVARGRRPSIGMIHSGSRSPVAQLNHSSDLSPRSTGNNPITLSPRSRSRSPGVPLPNDSSTRSPRIDQNQRGRKRSIEALRFRRQLS